MGGGAENQRLCFRVAMRNSRESGLLRTIGARGSKAWTEMAAIPNGGLSRIFSRLLHQPLSDRI